jgi:putative SOS response-associated peptidase YedK
LSVPIPNGQVAEFKRWLAGLARDKVEVFIANPPIAVEAGPRWVLPMLRRAEERELPALAMHELRSREAADRKRERRLEKVRWAATTLVAAASMATSAAVALRCFKWQKLEGGKQPYRIVMRDRGPFALAGLWERWKPTDGGEPLQTFSIVTTEPNAVCAPILNRMPEVIAPADFDAWLSAAPGSETLRPFPAEPMEAYPVSNAVGNVKNDGPELVEPLPAWLAHCLPSGRIRIAGRPLGEPMRRWVVMAVLLLATGAALPASAGDRVDCIWPEPITALLKAEPTRVVAACRRLADQGDGIAQNNLGSLYYNGGGVRQDYAEAAKWYRKAADQGFAIAEYNLGSLYAYGEGVKQDYAEAAKWYRKAANWGNADAQTNLGVLYANGDGVPKDHIAAYMWFNLAAAQGDAGGAKGRDFLAATMTPSQIEQAKALAAAWKPMTGQ